MCILLACMSVHHVSAWCMQKPEEGIQSVGTGVVDCCNP